MQRGPICYTSTTFEKEMKKRIWKHGNDKQVLVVVVLMMVVEIVLMKVALVVLIMMV